MTTVSRWIRTWLIGLAASLLFVGAPQADPTIGDFSTFQQVSAQRVSRVVTEYEYLATATNGAPELENVTARVTSTSPNTVIIDGDLSFGDLAVGGDAVSTDGFSFRHDRRFPFDPAVLRFDFLFVVANDPPTADAGPDQTVFVTDTVTLDGSGSTDLNGDALTYDWSLSSAPAGSSAALSDPAAVMPTFEADLPGSYVAELVVNDGTVDSAPDSVTIDTENSPPVADAGPDQTVFVTDTVTLDGSASSDVDGDPLTFAWTLAGVPQGSSATLFDPTAVNPSFDVDLPGSYVAELVVNDGTVDSNPDTITVDTENSPPVADAGPDQTVFVTDTVMLDGSASSDVDGDLLSFDWSLVSTPAGSFATIGDPASVMPTFEADLPGTYVAQLVVNDGTVDSDPDTVTIDTENSPPVADAGPDQTVFVTDTVTLDGSGSSDVDGDGLTYFWSLTSVPAGSLAALSNAGAVMPTFTADLPGTYVAQLIVNDGTVDSDPDSVTIDTENSPPVADAGEDQTVFVTDTVLLDGNGSSDVDGDPLTFAWSFTALPAGSLADFDDPFSATPSFDADLPGTYVAQLIVNDGTVDSDPDSAVIVTENSPPVANAGPDRNIAFGAAATLDGSLSRDVDGDVLTYQWTLVAVPAGSAAALDDPASVTPSFFADTLGDYVAELVVNDGALDSLPDRVTLTVDPLGSLTTFRRTIGAGLQFSGARADLNIANHGGVTVHIESSDPTVALIAPDGFTAGFGSLDVFVPDGSTSASYTMQAVAGARGTATVTVSTPGFTGGQATITVVEPGVAIFALANSLPIGVNDSLSVLFGQPNGAGTGLFSFQQASAANDPPLELTLTSSDGTVGQLSLTAGGATSDSLAIPLPAGTFQPGAVFVPLATGATTVTASIPGFLTTTAGTVDIAVTPPLFSIFARDTAAGLQFSTTASLGIADHGGVTVRIESDNPAAALVAPDGLTPGDPFIDVFVADGSTTVPYTVQGVAGAAGTANLTFSAPGFADGVTVTNVLQPGVAIFGLSGSLPVGAVDAFSVFLGIPNCAGTGIGTIRAVSAAAAPLVLTLSSSDGIVGELSAGGSTGGTITLDVPANVSRPSATFLPLAAGSTTVTVSAPGFLTTTTGTLDVTVTP